MTAADELRGAVTAALVAFLSAEGNEANSSACASLCDALELFIPRVLMRVDEKWRGESLDAVFPALVKKRERGVEMIGTCVLISDQSRTPFFVGLDVDESLEQLTAIEIRVGEPGGGALGISGPPTNSGAATRMHDRIPARVELDRVDWIFEFDSSDEPTWN